MTDGAKTVLRFMQGQVEPLTKQAIAEMAGVSVATVTGSTNGFIKKGYAVQTEEKSVNAAGKEVVLKYVQLTAEGYAYDPDEEDARIAAAKLAEKEARVAAAKLNN